MSADGVDLKRRRMLTAATSVVGAVGAAYVAVPFISSMTPSERAKAAGAPVEADISKMEEGQLLRVEWRGKPVWILRRPKAWLDLMAQGEGTLADVDSAKSVQPEYCQNKHRSKNPEFFVAVGICTHLGCSPNFFTPEVKPAGFAGDWFGGFFCACHGSIFDLAGRVYKGVPAPTNLEIPPYSFVNDGLVLIGEDGGEVA